MKKFKKVMLGVLSVLTFGLFAVVSTKVNAATVDLRSSSTVDSTVAGNTYVLTAANIVTDGDTTTSSGKVIAASMGFASFSGGNYTIDSRSFSFDTDSKSWDKGVRTNGSKRVITFVVGANQNVDISMYTYTNESSGTFTITIANSTTTSYTISQFSNTVSKYTTRCVNSSNSSVNYTIAFSAAKIGFTEIDFVTSEISNDARSIKYNVDGGTLQAGYSNPDEVDAGTEITLPTISKAGYDFNYWTCNLDDNHYSSGQSYTVSNNVEFTANFTKDNTKWVDLTFDANGGNDVDTINALIGGTVSLPSANRVGYKFDGWLLNSTTYAAEASYTVSTPVTFVAQWTEVHMPEQTDSKYILNASNLSAGDINSETAIAGTIFTLIATSDSKLTVDSNSQSISDGASTVSFTKRLKTNGTSSTSARSIKMVVDKPGKLNIICLSGSSSNVREAKVFTSSETIGTVVAPKTEIYMQSVDIDEAGTYYIGSSSSGVNFYYLEFVEAKLSDNTTASVFAEKNTAGDTLRFVGTITGINDLADISTIELILKKDGVATTSQIFLTTCYTSVVGSSQTCGEAVGTYYVILRLTDIDSLPEGTKISKQLKVTFTDGSTTISDASEITL